MVLFATAVAGEFQSVESMRAAALATVPDRDAPGVEVRVSLDEGLRMPLCPQPLTAYSGALGTAEVACSAAGWRLHVPIRVRRLQPVVVLTRTLGFGEVIVAESIRIEQRDVAKLAKASFDGPEGVIGRTVKRALAADTVLSPQDLVSQHAIQRGDNVTLVFRTAGLEVRAPGRALAAAVPEDRLNVENLSSRRTVRGILRENGEVMVTR